MTITAAQLTANVSVTGADKAKADLISVGETAESSGGVLKGALGGMALAAGAALVGIGVQSLKMAGDFEAGITSLKTGAGESQGNLKKVSDGILKMATDTGTSTKQLTDGMYMIESAGFHGAAGLSVLTAASQGAKVGGADLGVVAGGVTSIMHDYASSNYTATQATNALVTTVASGKTHMQDMASSLAAVLPLASSLHIPFEQVSGALATMTNAGVPAQRASQNLANAIRSLNVETSSGSNALDSIGLSAKKVHDTLLNQGLPATLQMVEDHIGKKWPLASLDGQTALKSIMGGATGLNVALMIGGGHMKEYQGDVNSIGDALRSKSKDVQGWSDVQSTFNFKMDKAKEVVETLGIKIGTALMPTVSKIVDWVTQAAQKFSDWEGKTHGIENAISTAKKVIEDTANAIKKMTDFFQSNSIQAQIVKDLLIGIGVAIAAIGIGAFLAALPALLVAFGAWAVAAGAAAIATIAAALPIIAIGAVIALVVGGIILAVQHWGEISKWLTGVWKGVQGFFGELWHGIQGVFGGIGGWFHDRFNDALNAIKAVFGGIGKWFQDRLMDIYNYYKPGIILIGQIFQTLWNIIVAIFQKLGAWFHDRFVEAWTAIVAVFGGIGKWFQDRWNEVVKFLSPIGQWFKDRFVEAWNNVIYNFISIGKWFLDRWNEVVHFLTPIGQWFKDRFTEAWNNIVAIFTPIGKWFSDRWNDVVNGVVSFKNAVVAKFNDVENGVTAIFKGMINGIIDLLNDGITSVESFINFFGQGLDNIAKALGTTGTIQVVHLGRIPHYESGTAEHPGGPAVVGERGRELVFLPRGASVVPNDMTEKLLGGSVPGYAGGAGDWINNVEGWIASGAQSVMNNMVKALGIVVPNLGNLSNIATGIFNTVEKWALNWINGIIGKVGGGTAGPGQAVNVPGNVASWIMAAIGLTGVPSSWLSALETIAMHESGGSPTAINNWDSNAAAGHPSEGLMQTIGPTFAAHMVAGHGNILNPIDNAAAAINYIKAVYGSVFNVPGIKSMAGGGSYQGYADGTSFAAGGFSWVGERGKELMYVPRGAQITPHEQLNRAGQQQQITVNPPGVYLDGRILVNGLMPYITDAIRYNVGTHNI